MKDSHILSRRRCSLFLATLLITNAPMWATDGKLKKTRGIEGQFCAASKSQTDPLLQQDGLSRAFRETGIPDVFDVLSPGADGWVQLGAFRLLKTMPYSLPDHFRTDKNIDNVKTSLMFGELTAPSGETEFVSAIVTDARKNPPRDSNGARLTFFGIVDRGSSASDVLSVTEALSYHSALQSKTNAEFQLDEFSFDGGGDGFRGGFPGCFEGCQVTYRVQTFVCRAAHVVRRVLCDAGLVACVASCCTSFLLCPRCYNRCTAANAGCLDLNDALLNACYFSAGRQLDHCLLGCATPIIVDLDGRQGIKLSGPIDGVAFDLNADGQAEQTAWTLEPTGDAFLALDRNENGSIDNGSELFGNFTPLADGSLAEHGFQVLIEMDTASHGGNGNNLIDAGDSVFDSLLFWVDANHNGVSEEAELKPVASEGLQWISLDFVENNRRDRHGNAFRYNTNVRLSVNGHERTVRASDVFLVVQGQ